MAPGRERQQSPPHTLGVEDLGQDAVPVQRVTEAAERHGEAALVVGVAPAVGVRDDLCHLVCGDVPVATDPGGVAVTLEPVHRLPDRTHVTAVKGVLGELDDRLIAQ